MLEGECYNSNQFHFYLENQVTELPSMTKHTGGSIEALKAKEAVNSFCRNQLEGYGFCQCKIISLWQSYVADCAIGVVLCFSRLCACPLRRAWTSPVPLSTLRASRWLWQACSISRQTGMLHLILQMYIMLSILIVFMVSLTC